MMSRWTVERGECGGGGRAERKQIARERIVPSVWPVDINDRRVIPLGRPTIGVLFGAGVDQARDDW